MTVGEAIRTYRDTLPEGVTLVAVSKFHPAEAIREAYDAGQRIFGESRVQELLQKIPQLPGDIRWHMIGHLQTNKVRQIIGRTALIESVDSLRLLDAIDAESLRAGTVTRVLLEVRIAREDTKTGFAPRDILDYFAHGGYRNLQATHICGLMAMASNTDDTGTVAGEFARAHRLMQQVRDMAPDLRGFDTLSMGMSDDYLLAIQNGSTMVRIGTAIFGNRL